MYLTAVKKQTVESSSISDRPNCTAGRRVRKMLHPRRGANSASTKIRCVALRAQMICSDG
jgi:hypothetical protein